MKIINIILVIGIILAVGITLFFLLIENTEDIEEIKEVEINNGNSFNAINYGNSRILLKNFNDNILFTIESRLFYDNQELYLTSDMPLEHTYSKNDLFQESNEKISFVFINNSNFFINFRGTYNAAYVNGVQEEGYNVKKIIKTERYKIIGFNEVRNYLNGEYKFVGITVYYINNSKIILEYPIKTINYLDEEEIYQSDTGQILFINPGNERFEVGNIIVSSFNNTELKIGYGLADIFKISAKNYIGVLEL